MHSTLANVVKDSPTYVIHFKTDLEAKILISGERVVVCLLFVCFACFSISKNGKDRQIKRAVLPSVV